MSPNWFMQRSSEAEILDRPGVPEDLVKRAYRDLTRIHRLLGDTAAIISALRRDPRPVHRVLDVGCGRGGVLADIQLALGVEAVGIDLMQASTPGAPFPIVQADAVRDALPEADVAYSMYLAHHLTEDDLVALIRNIGRFCRRFILLDLVRHPVPLNLFRLFLAPFVSPIVASDGRVSIRRSYTPAELEYQVRRALGNSGCRFRHSVSPLYIRQIVDISY